MGIFASQEDSIKEEDRESAFARIEQQFLKIPDLPEEVHLCTLFVGDNGVGKSGAATTYLKFLKDDECMIYVDLDAGDMENLVQYWKEEVADGKLRYFYPSQWQLEAENDKQARINYDKTIEELRLIAMWVIEEDEKGVPNHEKYNVKAIVLDGVSKLKNYAEYQMKNELNMDRGGDPSRRYWRIRNVDFLETLELYKVIPVDTIFVGKDDFNKSPDDMRALDRETNDLVSQKILFKRVEQADGKVQFIAKVLKSRQSFEDREREIVFAQIDQNKDDDDPERTCWDAKRVYKLLRPSLFEDEEKEDKPEKGKKLEEEKPKVPPKKTTKKRGRPKKSEPKKEIETEEQEAPFG